MWTAGFEPDAVEFLRPPAMSLLIALGWVAGAGLVEVA